MTDESRRQSTIVGGRWWRCSSYEFVGNLISPAKGSTIQQYNPWESVLASGAVDRKKESPYDSLVTLFRSLKVKPGVGDRRFLLTPEDEARVLAWCENHGLLGILPTRTQMISLHPRWERGDKGDPGVSPDLLYPVQRGFVLTSVGWVPQRRRARWRSEPVTSSNRTGPKEGDLAPLDGLASEWPRPGILIRPLDHPTWRMEPFSESWTRYFRPREGIKTEEIAWPSPVSEEFCKSYSEPLDDFLTGAAMLDSALTSLADAAARPQNTPDEDSKVRTGLARLNLLTSSVHPILLPSRSNAYEQRWLAPTLLSSYAMMVLLDLADPSRRPVRCIVCGTLFHTSSPTAEYCSERCRDTSYKRRKREKDKNERAKRKRRRGKK